MYALLGDSEKVDLILYLMLETSGLYETTLPRISHFELNFPTFWDNELLDLLEENFSEKMKKIHEKEHQVYTRIQTIWPRSFPNISEDVFLEALYNVKSRSGKVRSLKINENTTYNTSILNLSIPIIIIC